MASTTTASPDRCLSDFPDEILQHILGFAPCREAASTAVLSRRWRGLWPPTPAGAVNLDTRSYGGNRQAFFRGAEAAIAAHGGPVTRLTVHIESNGHNNIQGFMSRSCWIEGCHCHSVHDLLRLPAISAVEVLSIGAGRSNLPAAVAAADDDSESAMPYNGEGLYRLSMDSIPSKALRVLRITNCRDLERPFPATTGFQSLEALLLRRCTVSLNLLQDMVVASPELTTLRLERVYLTTEFRRLVPGMWQSDEQEDFDDDRFESFCCPSVITLALLNCSLTKGVVIELDAPRMRQFRYRGYTHQFMLKSPPPDLRRADLHVLDNDDDCPASEFFWLFVKNLRDTKVLKLKFNFPISEIAVADKKRFEELVGENRFCNLDLLETDVQQHKCSRKGDAAGVAIGNLLQCCPAVPELRLKLGTVENTPNRRRYRSSHQEDCSERNRKAQLDFCKSVRHFTHRREPVASIGGHAHEFEVSDIPGLSDKWFDINCLRFYLKRVSLQFQMDKYSNCFGVQLLKFFMERAMVLEEIHIDDGNKKLWDHMNRNIGEASSGFSLRGASKVPGANRLDYSSKICGRFSYPKIEVSRKNPWSQGSFTILPLDR